MRRAAVMALVAALAMPAAVSAAKPRTYTGTTSIGTKVGFKLASGQARSFAIGYVADCDDGETLRGTFKFKPATLKDGRFTVNGPSSGTLPDGRATASKLRLSGSVGKRSARGAFSITTQMARPDGQGVATCNSSRITWKAAR